VFLESRIDTLLKPRVRGLPDSKVDDDTRHARDVARLIINDSTASVPGVDAVDEWLDLIHDELRVIKMGIGQVYSHLKKLDMRLRFQRDENPIAPTLPLFGIGRSQLLGILKTVDHGERLEAARRLLEVHAHKQAFNTAARALRDLFRTVFECASKQCFDILKIDAGTPESMIKSYLQDCYKNYDRYDISVFGLQYGTEVGEGQEVAVVRISPEDADGLLSEHDTNGDRVLGKLAGTALGNFAGFLDLRWRRNDMLWGRLDAADRIIHALVSDVERAKVFSLEAQARIISQEIEGLGKKEAQRLIVESVLRARHDTDGRAALVRMTHELSKSSSLSDGAREALRLNELLDVFEESYSKQKGVPPEHGLRLLSRATTVFGRLLDNEAKRRDVKAGQTIAHYVIVASRFVWAFIEVSVPGRFWRLSANWWWKLGYTTAILIALLGAVTEPAVRNVGITLFLALIFLDMARRWLGKRLTFGNKQERAGWRTWLYVFAGFALGCSLGWVLLPRLVDLIHTAARVASEALQILQSWFVTPRSWVSLVVGLMGATVGRVISKWRSPGRSKGPGYDATCTSANQSVKGNRSGRK
jgi:hypothetical protein